MSERKYESFKVHYIQVSEITMKIKVPRQRGRDVKDR